MGTIVTWVGRAFLPFSFIIACVLAPRVMLGSLADWPDIIRTLWDDPL